MRKPVVGNVASDSGDSNRVDGAISESGPVNGAVDTNTVADAEPPKRRGGWPAGKPRAGKTGGNAGSGNARASGTSRSTKEKVPLDLSGITGALVGIHLGIAAMTKMEHWAIDDSEAEALAKSVANVSRHYPSIAGSQKMVDWTMLIGAIGLMYVPRVLATKEAMEIRDKQKKFQEASNG